MIGLLLDDSGALQEFLLGNGACDGAEMRDFGGKVRFRVCSGRASNGGGVKSR